MSWFSISPDEMNATANGVETDISGIVDAGTTVDRALTSAGGAVGAATIVSALESFATARRTVVPGLAEFVHSCAMAARRITQDHEEGDSTMANNTSSAAHGLGLN